MQEELKLLYNYLRENGYNQDATRIEEVMEEISKNNSESAKKRLVAMCNPKYLGDLNIAEFDSVYEWWNFLENIALKARS